MRFPNPKGPNLENSQRQRGIAQRGTASKKNFSEAFEDFQRLSEVSRIELLTQKRPRLASQVAQIARCNRDVRCDSNRTSLIASDAKFFCDAKTHSLDLKSQENARKQACENPAMLACDAKNQGVF